MDKTRVSVFNMTREPFQNCRKKIQSKQAKLNKYHIHFYLGHAFSYFHHHK